MNEDEAFIRALLNNPGDDLPRLVYADWLDDRSDPRGSFLRAGCASAGEAWLRERAAGLDPVWVARVSRPPLGVCCDKLTGDGHQTTSTPCASPPLGVCCDKLTGRERGQMIKGADVDRFEGRFRITLPAQYRAFLLNGNGGSVELGHRDRWCRFYSLAGTSENDPVLSLEHEHAFRRDSVFKGTRRENNNLRVSLCNSMIIGTAFGGSAWVLLGIGAKNAGGIRSLTNGIRSEDDPVGPCEPLYFGSLSAYLLSLCECGVAS